MIAKQVNLREGFYDRNDVPLLPGPPGSSTRTRSRSRTRPHATKRITADAFVIATGSRPFRPADVDFSHPRIFDSDTLLTLDRTPVEHHHLRRRRGRLRVRLDVPQHADPRARWSTRATSCCRFSTTRSSTP